MLFAPDISKTFLKHLTNTLQTSDHLKLIMDNHARQHACLQKEEESSLIYHSKNNNWWQITACCKGFLMEIPHEIFLAFEPFQSFSFFDSQFILALQKNMRNPNRN